MSPKVDFISSGYTVFFSQLMMDKTFEFFCNEYFKGNPSFSHIWFEFVQCHLHASALMLYFDLSMSSKT